MCSAVEEYLVTGQASAGLSVRHLPSWQPLASAPAINGGTVGGMSACVLVCAHKLRDKRCGVAGPLLVEALTEACGRSGLTPSTVPVLPCSHVGGHKFAGNIIVYGPGGGHWYGRVKPCHADTIVSTHILGGRVIKELWRGRMEA